MAEKIIVVDNLYSGVVENIKHHIDKGRVYLVRRSVYDKDFIDKVGGFGGIDAIIHLAAIVGVDEAYRYPWEAVMTNVAGTLNILEYARRRDVERIVYASSAAVYGDPEYLPIDEDHPTKPLSLYGETKLMGERLLWNYHRDYGLKPIALRYFNVYGPRMRPGPYSGVIYKFIKTLMEGGRPVIFGDGGQTRDFVYVRDVAEANITALDKEYVGALNIGTGRGVTIRELYRTICGLIGYCPEPVYGEPRPGDIYHSVSSIEKAMRILGWKPKYSLSIGLRETVSYYRSRIGGTT